MRTKTSHTSSSYQGLTDWSSSSLSRTTDSASDCDEKHPWNIAKRSIVNHGTYSQRNRQFAVLENLQIASEYIRSQTKTINDMIKQFHLFSGYLEQVSHKRRSGPQAWSVYLMYAQSISHSLNLSFRGNNLFQKNGEPPLRIHILQEGLTCPIDLPLPPLSSLISINSFISGVLDHKLPTHSLVQSCITDLMDELLSLHSAKSDISNHIKATKSMPNSQSKEITVKRVVDNNVINAHKNIFMQIKRFFQEQLV